MSRIISIEKKTIFNKNKLRELAKECVKLNSNLLIFGLPYSGKSTLVREICKTSEKFITLDEEEIMSEENGLSVNYPQLKQWAS